MSAPRRLCRALACPRHVQRSVLFCQVHWQMLPPKLQQPIRSNREATAMVAISGQRAVVTGVANAVSYIARKEGRGRQLQQQVQQAVSAPSTGTVSDQTSTSGGSATGTGGTGTGKDGGIQQHIGGQTP